MAGSRYLAGLTDEQPEKLKQRLHDWQTGRCFICDERIDLVLHKGQLEVDHLDPLAEDGVDAEKNVALIHASFDRRLNPARPNSVGIHRARSSSRQRVRHGDSL